MTDIDETTETTEEGGGGLPQSVTLKVYGESQEVPLSDVIADAQKYRAASTKFADADKKLAEAKALADRHKVALETYEDLQKMKSGDADATRRLLISLGNDEAAVDAYLKGNTSAKGGNGNGGSSPLSADVVKAVLKEMEIDLDALKELQEFRGKLKTGGIGAGAVADQIVNATAQSRDALIRDHLRAALNENAATKRMLSQGADPEALVDLAEGLLAKRTAGQAIDGTSIKNAVLESAAKLSKLGGSRSPSTLVAGGELPDDAYFDLDKPLKAPPITSPEHAEYTHKRLLQISRELEAREK